MKGGSGALLQCGEGGKGSGDGSGYLIGMDGDTINMAAVLHSTHDLRVVRERLPVGMAHVLNVPPQC